MITFLNSTFLYGLAAVSLPLVIHFLNRRKPRKIHFSTLRFLKVLQRQRMRRLKIRQILLLVLRSLVIMFIVLAFARPTLKGSFSVIGSRAKTSAVIILDNSFSMGAEENGVQFYEKAKRKSLEVLDLLKEEDEAALIFSADPSEKTLQGPTNNPARLKDILFGSGVSFRLAHLLKAVRTADKALAKSEHFNKEIYVISDFQRVSFDEKDYRKDQLRSKARIFLLSLGHELKRNVGIERVQVANQILERSKPLQIEAILRNYAQEPVKEVLAQLYINGKRRGQVSLDLERRASLKAVFRVVPEQAGQFNGWVEIDEDSLPADNRRYFAFFIPPEIRTLLVGSSEQDIRYLSLALKPTKDISSSIVVQQSLYEELDTLQYRNYDVIFFSNISVFSREQVQRIKDFLIAGGGVILLPGSNVDLKAYNDHFLKELDLPLLTGTSGKMGNRETYLSLGWIDYSHPLFTGLFQKGKESIDSPHFYFVLNAQQNNTEIRYGGKAERIIDYNNGAPFLEEIKVEKGRVLLFTSGMDLDWSNFPHKSIFAPLVNRCVQYLAADLGNLEEENLVGTELTLATQQQGREYLVEKPDGNRVKVLPKIAGDSIILNYNDTDFPGVYRLFVDGKSLRIWPVNVDPKESTLERIELGKVKELLGNGLVQVIGQHDDLKNVVERVRYGRELWKQCVLIATALLVLEMLLSRERKPSQQGQ